MKTEWQRSVPQLSAPEERGGGGGGGGGRGRGGGTGGVWRLSSVDNKIIITLLGHLLQRMPGGGILP